MGVNEAPRIAAALPCWDGEVRLRRLEGGISNENFLITDGDRRFVARVNGDVPEHGVLRVNDANCNRAAAAIGVAPAVHYAGPGAVVTRHVEGRTLTESDVRTDNVLERLLPLLRRTHRDGLRHLRGPVCAFWPFRVCRDYAVFLAGQGSRMAAELPRLEAHNDRLEGMIAPFTPVLAHNDLLAANLIDDGRRLWLIDWEHAGFGHPLFDLANLSSNNTLSPAQDDWLLRHYFEAAPDPAMRVQFAALKAASLLREAMWSMVSEITSSLDFDYVGYSDLFLARFDAAMQDLESPAAAAAG